MTLLPRRTARVVVDVRPIPDPLDYLVPDGLDVAVGSLVRVPLGGRRVRGWIIGFGDENDIAPEIAAALRPIAGRVTDIDVASPETVRLALHAAADAAGAAATVLAWATPSPLPRALPPAQARPGGPAEGLGGLRRRIRAGDRVVAFVRTWPGDDAASTIVPLVDAMPDGRSTLVVAPAGAAPTIPGALVVGGERDRFRTAAWEAAVAGTARCVVAGRHGPLIPVPDLGLIVVTMPHSAAHKDEHTPTLDARTLAWDLARTHGIPLVAVGAHSPVGHEGVRARAAVDGIDLVELTAPAADRHWPSVEVVDLTADDAGGPLPHRFFTAVRATLDTGGRVLCFLNRTGTARALVCRACGRSATCSECGGLYAPDANSTTLICRRCGHAPGYVACPSCASSKLRRVGIGTTRLRNELAKAFGGVDVLEASGDDAPLPDGAGIVVGTQVALRHRRTFDLVVAIDPDAELARDGLRGEECAVGRLVDAAGAARGRDDGGRLLLPSRDPHHAALLAFTRHDLRGYEDLLLAARKPAGLPPWRRILAVECSDFGPLPAVAADLRAAGAEVLGPVAEPKPSLLAFAGASDWPEVCAAARAGVLAHPHVRLRVEADPLDPH